MEEKSKWAERYAKWKKDSGGKWWLYQYFKLAEKEIRRANPGRPKIKTEIKDSYDKYEILKKE